MPIEKWKTKLISLQFRLVDPWIRLYIFQTYAFVNMLLKSLLKRLASSFGFIELSAVFIEGSVMASDV